jgi:hypothetical protein
MTRPIPRDTAQTRTVVLSSKPGPLRMSHSAQFSSYADCEPSALLLYDTRPPHARASSQRLSISAGARMPRAGVTPSPSWLAVKLKKAAPAGAARDAAAHDVSCVASPVCSEWTTSGGSEKL